MILYLSEERKSSQVGKNKTVVCSKAGEAFQERGSCQPRQLLQGVEAESGREKGTRLGNWLVTSDLCQSKTGQDRKMFHKELCEPRPLVTGKRR